MEYDKSFDSKDYLNRYYKTIKGSKDENFENYLHDRLSEVFKLDFIKGDWLLDVGTGPCLHSSFYSSKKFKNIVLSDKARTSRIELIKWLSNASDAHDWNDFSSYAAKLERTDELSNLNGSFIEERTKEAIKAVVSIDVHKTNPLEPTWFQKFDCILSVLCLEAACLDLDSLEKAINNLKTLLKPNGFFIMSGVLQETFYAIGEIKWPTCSLKLDDLHQIFKANKLSICYEKQLALNRTEFSSSDCQGLFTIVAQFLN